MEKLKTKYFVEVLSLMVMILAVGIMVNSHLLSLRQTTQNLSLTNPYPAQAAVAMGPLRVDKSVNGRFFINPSGKAVYLGGFHTWGNFRNDGINAHKEFNYVEYLNRSQQYGHNLVRLWALDLTKYTYDGTNISYVDYFPWKRVGPAAALDGGLKFDLNQFDDAYFNRLKDYLTQAQTRGIYVDIMFFEGHGVKNSHSSWSWKGHPFNVNNNINGVNGDPNGDGSGVEINTRGSVPASVDSVQKAYIRKVIDFVLQNGFDNVLYEVINEPDESYGLDWSTDILNYIKSYQVGKSKVFPVGLTAMGGGQTSNLKATSADWISPNNRGGYDRDNPPVATGDKVVIVDTDHMSGGCIQGTSNQSWCTRKWVWQQFTRGYSAILMDDYPSYYGNGEWAVAEEMRKNLGYIKKYADKIDLLRLNPKSATSDCSTTWCLVNPGVEYLVYQPSSGSFSVNLATGTYAVEWFNPSNGSTTSGSAVTVSAGSKSFTQPSTITSDAVLYLKVSSALPSPTIASIPTPTTGTAPTAKPTTPLGQPTPTSFPPTPTTSSPLPTPTTPPVVTGSNLLNNGDIETSLWQSGSFNGVPSTNTWATDVYKSTSHSLKSTSAGDFYTYWDSSFVPVKPGSNYNFSAWVKTASITTGVTVNVGWYNASGTQIKWDPWLGGTASGTADWKLLSATKASPPDAVKAKVQIRVQSSGGTAWIDDVNIVEGSSAPVPTPTPAIINLVPNWSMESGVWTSGAYSGTNPIRTWSTDAFHSTSHSLKTTGSSYYAYWDSTLFSVSPGKSYDAYMWIKTLGFTGVNSGARLNIHWYDASGNWISWVSNVGGTIMGNTDWKQVGSAVTVPQGASKAKVQVRIDASTGTSWIDDISFTVK